MKARKSVHYKHVTMSELSSLAYAESPLQSKVGFFFELRITTAPLTHSARTSTLKHTSAAKQVSLIKSLVCLHYSLLKKIAC